MCHRGTAGKRAPYPNQVTNPCISQRTLLRACRRHREQPASQSDPWPLCNDWRTEPTMFLCAGDRRFLVLLEQVRDKTQLRSNWLRRGRLSQPQQSPTFCANWRRAGGNDRRILNPVTVSVPQPLHDSFPKLAEGAARGPKNVLGLCGKRGKVRTRIVSLRRSQVSPVGRSVPTLYPTASTLTRYNHRGTLLRIKQGFHNRAVPQVGSIGQASARTFEARFVAKMTWREHGKSLRLWPHDISCY